MQPLCVSPFVGRLDDISSNGMSLISDLSEVFLNYGFMTEILVASIRNPIHIVESAKLGVRCSNSSLFGNHAII